MTARTGGATRLVILTRRWAIKLPALQNWIYGNGFRERVTNLWKGILRGMLCNMQETQFARSGMPGADEKLMPVVFRIPGGLLNVMPRGEDLTREEWFGMDTCDFIDCGDWVIPAEAKMCSFKRWKGRVVCVDYG